MAVRNTYDPKKLITDLKEAEHLLEKAKPYMTDPFCISKAIRLIESQKENEDDSKNM